MRHRWLTYLTVLFTLLFPLFGALWTRSYLHDDLLYRVGDGYGVMLSSIRGELALWWGPAGDERRVRWGHESNHAGFALRASEMLAQDRGAQQHWVMGLGYARTYAFAPSDRGAVRCVVMPAWFLMLLSGMFPARVVLRHVRRNRAAAEAELARCRRCGAELSAGETSCAACRFPAFVRRGVVA